MEQGAAVSVDTAVCCRRLVHIVLHHLILTLALFLSPRRRTLKLKGVDSARSYESDEGVMIVQIYDDDVLVDERLCERAPGMCAFRWNEITRC